jgi:hypothetical protein
MTLGGNTFCFINAVTIRQLLEVFVMKKKKREITGMRKECAERGMEIEVRKLIR